MRKKEYKQLLKKMEEELEVYKIRNNDLEVWYDNNQVKIRESEEWRARYEQLLLTPEYKLKAEDAYNRGVAQTQENVKNYLRVIIDGLFQEPEDKPEIKSWLTEEAK